MEPWHVSYRVDWTQDKMSQHDECLVRIHIMEHELEMRPGFNEGCEICWSAARDDLLNKIASRYDPNIEGEIKR